MDTIIRAARLAGQTHRLQRVRPAPAPAPTEAPVAPVADTAALADQVLRAARIEAEAAAAVLFQDGRERGYAEGLAAGALEGRAALDAQAERLRTVAAALAGAQAQVLADAQDALVDLAFGAVCALLGEQAATRDFVAQQVGRHGAARAGQERVTIRLHPDDLALLQADGGAWAHCQADAAVALGGCLVDSSTGTLDARLETQLVRLRATLLAVRAQEAAP